MTPQKIVNGVVMFMTPEEIAANDPANTPVEVLAEEVRNKRNDLLKETDWMALSDVTMTPEMAAYRQALRDITSQERFPYSVVWPVKP